MEEYLCAGTGDGKNLARALEDRPFIRIADVDGKMFLRAGQAQNAIDEIGDITEAARLRTVAVDGEGLPLQGLHHEVRDDAAVVGLEPGAIGVEDTDEVGIHTVVAMVGHDGSLREALGFIVDRTQADGIDITPVGLDLGMDLGIAVALGGRGVEVAGAMFAGEVERVEGAGGADEEGLGTKTSVVSGAGRRGEVEDEIDFARVEWLRDVLFEEAEAAFAFEVAEIGEFACAEVIDTNDRVAVSQQRVTKMRAEKAGRSCDKNVSRHHLLPFLSGILRPFHCLRGNDLSLARVLSVCPQTQELTNGRC